MIDFLLTPIVIWTALMVAIGTVFLAGATLSVTNSLLAAPMSPTESSRGVIDYTRADNPLCHLGSSTYRGKLFLSRPL